MNRPYAAILARIRNRGKSGYKATEIPQLHKLKRTIPSLDPNDPDFRRLRYVRYADDVRHIT